MSEPEAYYFDDHLSEEGPCQENVDCVENLFIGGVDWVLIHCQDQSVQDDQEKDSQGEESIHTDLQEEALDPNLYSLDSVSSFPAPKLRELMTVDCCIPQSYIISDEVACWILNGNSLSRSLIFARVEIFDSEMRDLFARILHHFLDFIHYLEVADDITIVKDHLSLTLRLDHIFKIKIGCSVLGTINLRQRIVVLLLQCP